MLQRFKTKVFRLLQDTYFKISVLFLSKQTRVIIANELHYESLTLLNEHSKRAKLVYHNIIYLNQDAPSDVHGKIEQDFINAVGVNIDCYNKVYDNINRQFRITSDTYNDLNIYADSYLLTKKNINTLFNHGILEPLIPQSRFRFLNKLYNIGNVLNRMVHNKEFSNEDVKILTYELRKAKEKMTTVYETIKDIKIISKTKLEIQQSMEVRNIEHELKKSYHVLRKYLIK